MKKILILFALCATMMNAQNVGSSRNFGSSSNDDEFKKHEFSVLLSPGAFTGDIEGTGFGLELGFKYAYRFHPNVAWDAIKVSAITDTKNFTEMMQIQGLTGLRGITPVLFGKSTLYANFGAGYGYCTDFEKGGFAWEVGAGINVVPQFSIGFLYNSTHLTVRFHKGVMVSLESHGINIGFIGGRFAYTF